MKNNTFVIGERRYKRHCGEIRMNSLAGGGKPYKGGANSKN
jgi:hypothetical protein